jgi:hypothetical protein
MADEKATPVRSTAVVESPDAKSATGGSSERDTTGPSGAAKAKGGKPGKDKSKSKDKDKDKARGPAAGVPGDARSLTLAGHPRAVRGVARAKGWGGLGGFMLGGYLSLPTHALADAGLRALAAGVVCYVAAWAAAVFLWRRLVVAELSHARQELLATELAKLASSDPTVTAPERDRAGAAL